MPRVQEETADGGAALAGGADGAEEDGAEREIEVRIVHDDDAVVAAEFEERAAQALGRRLRQRGGPSAVEPVALISGMRAVVQSGARRLARLGPITRLKTPVQPWRSSTRLTDFLHGDRA